MSVAITDENNRFINTHRFTGKEYEDTGVYYFGARYYMPEIGRFITPEPLGMFEKNDPSTINPYVYCTNNPLRYVDPNGKWRTSVHRYAWPVTSDFAGREFVSSFSPLGDFLNCYVRSSTGDMTLSTGDWVLMDVGVVTSFIPGGKLERISPLLKAAVKAGPAAYNITKLTNNEVRQDRIIWRIAEKMGIVSADETIDLDIYGKEFEDIDDFVKELDKNYGELPEIYQEGHEEWYDIYKEETPYYD